MSPQGRDNLHAGISTHACDSASLDDLVAEVAQAGAGKLQAILDSYTQKAGMCPLSAGDRWMKYMVIKGNREDVEAIP